MVCRTMACRLAVVVALCGMAAALGADEQKAEPAKPKTELKLDTPENALASYIAAWKNLEYKAILASVSVTRAERQKTVEMYINFNMWAQALERACIAKFGEEEGVRALGHVRSLDKQYALDLKRVLSATVDIDLNNRAVARVFLKVERDRPEGLKVDDMTFRDDYWLIKQNGSWKIDYLKTYGLSDPERENEIGYNAGMAYPKIATRMKELTELVKKGEIKSADDVKTAISNEWTKLPEPALPKE